MRQTQPLKATFFGWKLPSDRVLKTKFEIVLYLESRGHGNYRWHARIANTRQPFPKDFAESSLEDAKRYVQGQFQEMVSEWA